MGQHEVARVALQVRQGIDAPEVRVLRRDAVEHDGVGQHAVEQLEGQPSLVGRQELPRGPVPEAALRVDPFRRAHDGAAVDLERSCIVGRELVELVRAEGLQAHGQDCSSAPSRSQAPYRLLQWAPPSVAVAVADPLSFRRGLVC